MVNKIKSFYAAHTIGKIFLTILLAAVLIYVLVSIPVWSVRKTPAPQTASREPLTGEKLANDAGKVTLAESGGKTLTLNTETLTFEVKDERGNVFSTAVSGTDAGTERALLTLTYLGDNNNLYEWNSYDQSVVFGSYELYRLENGVRIDMNLNEGESNRFYEYLPRKIAPERYEEMFLGGIEKLRDSGELDETRANRYLQTLSLVYKRSVQEECYAVTYTGTPPASAVTQMIEIAGLVGYTQEMLLEDADTFGFSVSFTEPAQFDIVLEVTLEEGELKAHIPSGACVSVNDFYTIQEIDLLPNFGAVTEAQYAEGQILIPDGSGALVDFNSYKADIRDYERPLYDNDYYKDYYFQPQYGEELNMPVFGMLYGPADKTEKGFLAIVEEGDRTGYIHMKLASQGADSSKYNKVFASFEVAQYTRVKINGAYSESSANYLVNTGTQDIDCTVRYLFYGAKAGYYDLAKGYQDYLAAREGIEKSYDDGSAKLYLEAVGALNITKRFVGIPYSSEYSMTDYEELLAIMQELEGTEYLMQYDGVFNNGWNGKMNNKAKLSSSNGSKKDWRAVREYAEANQIPLFLETSLTKVWEKGNGFRASRQAVRDFANDPAVNSRYMPVLGIQLASLSDGLQHDTYYTLSPQYLDDVTDDFLKGAGDYKYLSVGDLAGMFYADYRFNGFISGEQGNLVLENNLAKLAEGRELALTNPHIDKIGYGSVAVDISRKNSDYMTFARTIPFRQLVMNGLIDYTTENVNLSSRNPAYFVLQAAETGAYPKFVVTAKNVDALQDSDYSYLYSVQFSRIKDKIDEVYRECSEIRSKIGTSEITGHECLAEGVYRTTYATGVQVTVNYNLYDVTLEDGGSIEAEGYLVEEVQ
ncbi:MAG: DUF5696 domain-containing protein [Roseburia sp.]|nr:DUF5696 domain-containing protein [Roseburia sp.]MCM1098036.1 DUF5696 domain-containing protein [Ruminococcus flavefaciens]